MGLQGASFDGEGHLVGQPDTAVFDNWVKTWPQAKIFLVYMAVGNQFPPLSSFSVSRTMSAAFGCRMTSMSAPETSAAMAVVASHHTPRSFGSP